MYKHMHNFSEIAFFDDLFLLLDKQTLKILNFKFQTIVAKRRAPTNKTKQQQLVSILTESVCHTTRHS